LDTSSLFFQTQAQNLQIEKLPDGSMAIYDLRSKSVHSLNRSAAALWEACEGGATMPQLAESLGKRIGTPATEEEVPVWINQMRQLDLIVAKGARPATVPQPGRRSMLAGIGAALPVVLTLTAAEQRAYAQTSGSGQRLPPP
jgi:Coenzyme PQQ synthesis protein D (PqqD)